MGTHPIFESDFDCLTETGLSQKCPQNSTPPLLSKSTSVLSEERLEPPPRSPLKLAPSVSPPKKVGDDICKATGDWKGLKITVKLTIQNRQAQVSVVPSASSLIIKALKEPPRDRKKVKNVKHNGNITMDDIISIARTMRPRSGARDLSGTIREILGTAQSVGCTVDGEAPHDLIEQIRDGELDVPLE